jgi:hypothetical protein
MVSFYRVMTTENNFTMLRPYMVTRINASKNPGVSGRPIPNGILGFVKHDYIELVIDTMIVA